VAVQAAALVVAQERAVQALARAALEPVVQVQEPVVSVPIPA
jgi:hypothetical protein